MILSIVIGRILQYYDFQGLIHRPTYYSQASVCGDPIYFHIKIPVFRPTNISLSQKAFIRCRSIAIDTWFKRYFRFNIAFSSSYKGCT